MLKLMLLVNHLKKCVYKNSLYYTKQLFTISVYFVICVLCINYSIIIMLCIQYSILLHYQYIFLSCMPFVFSTKSS